jgi:hypothetical protein
MYLSFASNTTQLTVNITYVYNSFQMWHFPSTGVAGMDLYAFDENSSAWRWTATTHTQGPGLIASNTLTAMRVCSPTAVDTCTLTRYRLHLPLYNGVTKLSLGYNTKGAGCANNHCVLVADTDPRTLAVEAKPPVVWYGTSIAQGGVASRPGMAFTNSIASNIARPVLNFGFSGNGIMEIGVAQWLVQIKAAAYVIDCNWNMNGASIAKAIVPLVQYMRKTRPDTPIILAEVRHELPLLLLSSRPHQNLFCCPFCTQSSLSSHVCHRVLKLARHGSPPPHTKARRTSAAHSKLDSTR